MSPVDTQSLLMQMRTLAAQAQQQATPAQPSAPSSVPEGTDAFADLLKQGIEQVNQQQHKAGEMKQAFELGDPNVELSQVMLQAQKASLSFEAMTQVRNKLVEAYKEIMNMPI
jgi:flagellar hook-basal body complex protein FliE